MREPSQVKVVRWQQEPIVAHLYCKRPVKDRLLVAVRVARITAPGPRLCLVALAF